MKITLTPYDRKFDFANLCVICGKAHNKQDLFDAKEYRYWTASFGSKQIKDIQYEYCDREGCYSDKYSDDMVWARQVASITGLRIR